MEKLQHIKLLLTDCDGVLTDAGVYYGENGEVLKKFNIRDGMGVERLRNRQIATGIITGELSPSVRKRAEKLKITELHMGIKDKLAVLQQILVNRNILPEQIAYIGDDVNDLAVMKAVGLAVCPSSAVNAVKSECHIILSRKGGDACVREFIDQYLLPNGI